MNEQWHNINETDLLKALSTSHDGLTEKEALKRSIKNGKNVLPHKKEKTLLLVFLEQFKNPITYILFATIILSIVVGEYVDSVFIMVVILLDVTLGTFQEWNAEKNAHSLQNLITINTNVIRNGKSKPINSEDLVCGDLVLLESGDKISADMRLIEVNNFSVNESILTGESIEIYKTSKTLNEKKHLQYNNMVYAGTIVIKGRAKAIVVKTGINTELGKIADKITSIDDAKPPIVLRMERFTKQISLFIAFIALCLTILLYFKGYLPKDIFLLVVALSVSAIPEGLPIAITLTLSIASNKLSKKNVLVKKLNAVESLGSCTLIASDKTGTLTVNEQTAKKILLPDGKEYDISGIGYNTKGEVSNLDELAKQISILGSINNEAGLYLKDNHWNYHGDSIDVAFLVLLHKSKVSMELNNYIIKKMIPYESEQKYSAALYEYENKNYFTMKGSLEVLLDKCETMFSNDKIVKIDKELILEQNKTLTSNGYRVIAISNGIVDISDEKAEYHKDDISNQTLIGLVAFTDPVRKEVKGAIETCHQAGIKTVMITGDYPLTAYAIGRELNMVHSLNEVTNGDEIRDALSQGQNYFDAFVKEKLIFSRVSPIQKLEIVESYKRQGEFVAVTGDGANDALSLKAANIGVAMGSGTDVARETGSMIITDDNFLSITNGILEGRITYDNIRKVSYMLLSSGVAEVLFFILAVAFDLPLPLLAIQLLWLNLVTDGLQDVALAFEKGEPNVMKKKPRHPKENIFDKLLIKETLLSGISTGIIVFIFWIYLVKHLGYNLDLARGYILMLMVFMQNIHVLNCRSETRSIFKIPFKDNPFVILVIGMTIVLQIIVLEVPFLASIIKAETIPWKNVFYVMSLALPVLLIMEVFKLIERKK